MSAVITVQPGETFDLATIDHDLTGVRYLFNPTAEPVQYEIIGPIEKAYSLRVIDGPAIKT